MELIRRLLLSEILKKTRNSNDKEGVVSGVTVNGIIFTILYAKERSNVLATNYCCYIYKVKSWNASNKVIIMLLCY